MANRKFEWTEEWVKQLVRLRNKGASAKDIADELGVSDYVVLPKLRELGLSARMNNGAISGKSRAMKDATK